MDDWARYLTQGTACPHLAKKGRALIQIAPAETATAFDGARWLLPEEKGKWGIYAVRFYDGCV